MPEDIVTSADQIKRVKTYIKGLDETMQGGIPAGHITLVSGSAGTMKSSIAFNAYNVDIIYSLARCYKNDMEQSNKLIAKVRSLGGEIVSEFTKERKASDDLTDAQLQVSSLAKNRKQWSLQVGLYLQQWTKMKCWYLQDQF